MHVGRSSALRIVLKVIYTYYLILNWEKVVYSLACASAPLLIARFYMFFHLKQSVTMLIMCPWSSFLQIFDYLVLVYVEYQLLARLHL